MSAPRRLQSGPAIGALLRPLTLAACLLVLACTPGCSRKGGAQAPPGATALTIAAPGGDRPGFLYGGASERGIVLVAGDTNTDQWSSLAGELSRLGYRVLVIGLPSDGGAARAAGAELTRRGSDRILYVGSQAGAAPALAAATAGGAGVALLNPTAEPAPLPAAGGAPPVPLLALASLTDAQSSAVARRLYDAAGEPRTLALYPAREPAPAVFAGEGGELKNAFLDFLRSAFEPLSALDGQTPGGTGCTPALPGVSGSASNGPLGPPNRPLALIASMRTSTSRVALSSCSVIGA